MIGKVVSMLNCWAQVRRKFTDIKSNPPPECEKILEMIRFLFTVEQSVKDSKQELVLATRREKSAPLIESCKLQGVNPYDYILDVLQRISTHPARQVHELIPKNWKYNFGKNALE